MLPALVSLKSFIKTKSYHIDLPFFRLHYQATVCILLAFCLVLTAKVLFGDTIDCIGRMKKRDAIYDNICYAVGTYTKFKLDDYAYEPAQGEPVFDDPPENATFRVDPSSRYIHPGLMLGSGGKSDDDNYKTLWHNYYQYVPILLFVQATLFYFPHYLWKTWENGKIASICKQLHDNRYAPAEYLNSNFELIYYLQNFFRLNKTLVYKYYVCHLFLFFNILLQIIVLDVIFNYQFLYYGYTVFNYLYYKTDFYGMKFPSGRSQESDPTSKDLDVDRSLNNPMDIVFPKITVCRIDMASEAGKRQDTFYFMCVLPLNILHDKFFLIIWFWFLILAALTIVQIIYDLIYTTMPFFRKYMFTKNYGSSLWDNNSGRSTSLSEMFLLNLIGHNSDKYAFSALLSKLNKEDWTANPSENNHSIV